MNTIEDMTDDQLRVYIETHSSYTDRDAELIGAYIRVNDLTLDDIEEMEVKDTTFEFQGLEYLAGTDEECDILWDESLENYIDECVLHELPENYRQYFDNEKFKRDCRFDGRAHSLASYDGNEIEQQFNGTWYYFYRTN